MWSSDSNITLATRMQRLFYVVTPAESMFKTLDEVPNYVAEASLFFHFLQHM